MRPTLAQWRALMDELADHLSRLRQSGPALLARAEAGGTRDGYATSSRGGGSRPKGTHSDPVADLIVEREERQEADPVRTAALAMVHEARAARRALRAAAACAIGAEAMEPQLTGERASSIERCCNCGADCLPRPRAGRCWACYEYRRRHGGIDRPVVTGDREDAEMASIDELRRRRELPPTREVS